ncbi:LysR family transcriptional regulator [Nostocoides australiense]
METETLRWFQHVADGMTVTEVAETYAVSQPGVSRALARLEEELGAPLLRRSGRVLRLTAAGAVFKAHLDAMMAQYDDAVAAVEQLLDPGTGIVTLAYPLSLGTWFVPGLIRDFRAAHPGVRVRVARSSVGAVGAISRLLATREVDLEITTGRVSGPGVEWRQVAIEPLLLAVPLDHRLAGAEETELAHVAREPFIIRRAPSEMRAQVLQLCAAAGFEPDIAFEVDDLPTVRGFVAAGLGVGVVPALGRSVPTELGPVRLIPLRDNDARREVGIAWLSERRLLPAADLMRRFALAEAGRRRA